MKLQKDHLVFLPLGGSNEIGMNVNLYHYKGKWILMDFGAGFADEMLPGVDMIVPDINFILDNRKDFLGIVLTHAHEDHMGAMPYLWDQLECPVWATPFTANVVKAKMKSNSAHHDAFVKKLTIVNPGAEMKIGPFDLEFVQITHSIPEMNGVMIRTEHGNVFHTGDWKLDDTPVVGALTEEAKLRKYGDEGVLAMVCDSTNVFNDRISGSEGALLDSITQLVSTCKGLVVVSTFASNVARIETIARAAQRNGRKVALAGRSLWTVTTAAREAGYLQDIPAFISNLEIKKHKRDELLVICTGCQGEPNAAMAKLVKREHPDFRLSQQDTVIFSSKVIPGNEKKIFRMFNGLVRLGSEVFTEKDHFVHVSGHPSREELRKMYEWVRPQIAIPVHGEAAHLHEHVRFAKEIGIPKQIQMQNGQAVKLAPGTPEVLGVLDIKYFGVDGKQLLPPEGEVIRTRRKLMRDGIVIVSMALTRRGGFVEEPKIIAPGLVDDKVHRKLLREIAEEVMDVVESGRDNSNDEVIKTTRSLIRRIFEYEFGKRPGLVEVFITRV
ncbi:MAG: ribonuclease J [Proteobacteria bacterium]|nr:ribonuclease J [Pseudomonadota bacterium]